MNKVRIDCRTRLNLEGKDYRLHCRSSSLGLSKITFEEVQYHIPRMGIPTITDKDIQDAEKLFNEVHNFAAPIDGRIPTYVGKSISGIFMDECSKLSTDCADAMMMSFYQMENFKRHPAIKGQCKFEVKSKTKFITFIYKGRTVTLCGRNNGNKIEVGYSVYCDHLLDKRKTKTPKEDLSNKIAEGRLKNPIYTVNVDDSPANFILSALEVAKIKIRNGELIIKGIRDEKESNANN